jgi:hypothetical protein
MPDYSAVYRNPLEMVSEIAIIAVIDAQVAAVDRTNMLRQSGTSESPQRTDAPIGERRRRLPFVLAGLLVAGGIAATIYWSKLGKETTDDAQVEARPGAPNETR